MGKGTKILYGGLVYRNEEVSPEAICVRGDRIVGVGERSALRSALSGTVEEIDMEGACILPGFVEGHCHMLSLGQHLQSLSLHDCGSITQLKKQVREAAVSLPEDAWILGRGWDQDYFAERRYPTRYDLDEVSDGRPVFLRRACGHAAVANSAALRKAAVTADTPDPNGGLIERDEEGRPSGVLHEKAMGLIQEIIPQPSDRRRRDFLRAAVDECFKHGITSAHSNDHADTFASLLELYRSVCGSDSRRFRAYLDIPVGLMDDVRQHGWATGSGDKWVRLGAIKLFADGSLGARSAALSRSYADDPDSRGIMVTQPEKLAAEVQRAHRSGLQVAIHVIGDRALDSALDAIGAASRTTPRPPLRHRLVHCQITRPEQFERLAASGCVAAIQPKFVTTDQRWVNQRVGDELAETSYAWRTMLNEGIPCAGGSDAPVEPVPALLGIWAAVCRTDMQGSPEGGWLPQEKLSVLQAIDLFTAGGAYAEFSEEEKGQIRTGAFADFACVDRDLTSIPPEEIREVEVVETWVGGVPVYTAR